MEVTPVVSAGRRLANAARTLFGDDWTREFSRFTEINLRTCQRVKTAIDSDKPERRVEPLFDEFNRRLLGLAQYLSGAPSLQITGDRDHDLSRIRSLAADVAEERRYQSYGPFYQEELELLLSEAMAREESAANLLFTAAAAFGGGEASEEVEDHFFLRFNEACSALDAIYGRQYQEWDLEMLVPPRRVFANDRPLWPKVAYRRLFMIPCDKGESAALAKFKMIANHEDRPEGVEVQLYDDMFGHDFLFEGKTASFYVVVKILDSDMIGVTQSWLSGISDELKGYKIDRADAL